MSDGAIVAVSGGFDPVHVGHVNLLRGAAEYGWVLVLLNSDEWLLRKKGFVFMPWRERVAVLSAMYSVGYVSTVDDQDGTVVEGLRWWRPDYFANGGDRESADPLEHAVCEELGIEELFGVGGPKVQSSSDLIDAIRGYD